MIGTFADCSTGESVKREATPEEATVILALQAHAEAQQAAALVPAKVPRWRLHTIAELENLSTAIATAIAALPEPNRTIAYNGWHKSNDIERGSALVQQLGAAIGLTPEEMDQFFIDAAALPA